jgi:hypothetical protein
MANYALSVCRVCSVVDVINNVVRPLPELTTCTGNYANTGVVVDIRIAGSLFN